MIKYIRKENVILRKNTDLYTKKDFRKGDFILFKYLDDEYIRGEIVELKDKSAIIEIALSGKKTEEIKTETFEVSYNEIIPFSKVFLSFKKK